MSGGVDSSTSALILKKQGYDVCGITFVSSDFVNQGASDAEDICKKLGIRHIKLDIYHEFREKVINYFIDEYTHGRTPNPCVMCNKTIKFGILLDKATELGFDYLSTGHYVKIDETYGKRFIIRTPYGKDQSYYFYILSQNKLKLILTPLSDFTKEEVRQIAKEESLFVWNKAESQDVCFIKNEYRDFLFKNGVENKEGFFLDENGNILGKHNGLYNYTVGQRRGLGIFSKSRLYVKKINYLSNSIILCERVRIKKLELINFNFVLFDILRFRIKADILTRYNCKPHKGVIYPSGDKLIVEFENYAPFASLGQSAVFYINNILIGGGIINRLIDLF